VTQQTSPPQQYRPTATIQDLMDGSIDPSADVLWDSVAYIASEKGVEDRRPRTDAEWQAVRKSALTLIEAANLLSMPGRQVAAAQRSAGQPGAGQPGAGQPAAGSAADRGVESGELTPDQIQQRINGTRAAFVQLARVLQDAGLQALAAIEAQDAEGLMSAGGQIDTACEACHITYWYPNAQRPDQ
jgi:hypothetical protein